MLFSLIPPSGKTNTGFSSFSDGHLHLLQLYQSHKDASQAPEQKQHQVLYWHGSAGSLKNVYLWYRRLLVSLHEIAPNYGWDSQTKLEFWFGDAVSGPGFGSNMTGSVKLAVVGQGAAARKEIVAQLRRREKDWNNIHVESMRGAFTLVVCGGDPCEIEFSLDRNLGIGRLPLDTLADFIESTLPKALCHEKTGEKSPRDGSDYFEERFEPWPLSRQELMAALEQIQQEWFPPAKGTDTGQK